MPKYRVKAFFMHEPERHAAEAAERAQLLTEVDWTPGYAIGVVDQRDIKKLSDQGLVVTPIEEIRDDKARRGVRGEPAPTSLAPMAATRDSFARPRPLTVSAADKSTDAKIISRDPNVTQFYVVRLHGPLTEERRRALEQVGLRLLESLSNCSYIIRLQPDQVDLLAALSFVDTIRLYTENDTLRVSGGTTPPERTTGRPRRGVARRSVADDTQPEPSAQTARTLNL